MQRLPETIIRRLKNVDDDDGVGRKKEKKQRKKPGRK